MVKQVSTMRSLVLICSALLIIPFCASRSVNRSGSLDQTELLMTFLLHRHGDRTPVESTVSYSTDLEKLTEASAQYGYGQLTKAGIQRSYKLGGFIRERYNDFLSSRYNKSEIYIRSTDSTRAKMTVLTAMAAVYPLEENWCEDVESCADINWTPVPYTTVDAKYDFNLATVNCPAYLTAVGASYTSDASRMDEYSDLLAQWSSIIGLNISSMPVMAYALYDVYAAQIGLGIPLTPELEEIYPEIEEAAGAAMDVIFGSNAALGSGVLLNEFFVAAENVIAGDDVPRVRIYSAHDINVFTMEVATKVTERQGVPKYTSAYALELRRDLETGNNIVVPVYLNTPDSYEVTYLQVEGCDGFCELSEFKEIVADNLLKESEWRTKCDWSEDYDFDVSSIA